MIMVTGHRPPKIGGYDYYNSTRVKIRKKIEEILKQYNDVVGISGMALGVDQDFCEVCNILSIPFLAYIPFKGQEKKWPPKSQLVYNRLLEQAKEIKIISRGEYTPIKMQIRNEAMARDCDMAIAVWDRSSGGTANCVKYLESIEKEIIFVRW